MYRSLIVAMAALTAMPVIALAQTSTNTTDTSTKAANSNVPAATDSSTAQSAQQTPPANAQPSDTQQAQANEGQAAGQQQHRNIRRQLTGDLKRAGFTDVRVMPESFLVQAKDKSGDPVSMFFSPSGMTEVAAVPDNQNGDGQNSDQANTGTSEQANAASESGMSGGSGMFATVPASEQLGSKVIGLTVHNDANKDIGTIKDIALGHNGAVRAYIVGVGGFLGVDDRYVAVRPSAINFSYDANSKEWHARLDATAAQLKSAPQFRYSNGT